jgi:hypothetical protein
MKRQVSVILASVVGLGVLVPVWAQRSRESTSNTPEGRAYNLYLDIRDSRNLLTRVLQGAAREQGNSARDREGRRDYENDRRNLEKLLENAERNSRDLEQEVRRLQDTIREIQERNRGDNRFRDPIAMSDRSFRELTDAVRRQGFSGEKVNIIRLAARTELFNCQQLRELLGLLSYSSDQEAIAVAIYPRLVDQGRFYTLSNAFRFTTSWRTVCGKLGLQL